MCISSFVMDGASSTSSKRSSKTRQSIKNNASQDAIPPRRWSVAPGQATTGAYPAAPATTATATTATTATAATATAGTAPTTTAPATAPTTATATSPTATTAPSTATASCLSEAQSEAAALKLCEAKLAAQQQEVQKLEATLADKREHETRESEEVLNELAAARELRHEAAEAADEAISMRNRVCLEEAELAKRQETILASEADLAEECGLLRRSFEAEATIAEQLRSLLNEEAKCAELALAESESLRRELHDLSRMTRAPAPPASAASAQTVASTALSRSSSGNIRKASSTAAPVTGARRPSQNAFR
eukprot:TRINITY_DN16452_c0_g1_i1.p1 TRINITY_DN16452_c0_g1~~TRINITY_DN16452_c0_g1_i1.p1  ORF type:complete len:308 (-),score=88.28 TRINITY_DN16452_c0_g1_i1:47-970(-)